MPIPDTSKYVEVSDEFRTLWDFPNCVGTVDGKHIRLKSPENSGLFFYNYKHFFSIVLQGVADAQGCFISVDMGDTKMHQSSKIQHSASH